MRAVPVVLQYTMPSYSGERERRKKTTNSVQTFNFNTQLMLTAEKPFRAKKTQFFSIVFVKINLNYVCLTIATCSRYFAIEIKLTTILRPRCFCSLEMDSSVQHDAPKKISTRYDHFSHNIRCCLYTHTDTHPYNNIKYNKAYIE